MTPEAFKSLVAQLTASLHGHALDDALATQLNEQHGAGSPTYETLASACLQAVREGWMCKHGIAPLRYGRVIKAGPETHGFSVDVVDMTDVVGPHHIHPHGEIDLVMPLSSTDPLSSLGGPARFDGQGAGWKVYGPGSAHRPTVTGGRALVLYLLPEGAIQFTPT